MPEQEFEIYLSLLSKLLRLNPTQKAAISDELRDHMQERLETLIGSGLSRDEAIKKALDEFGDVTGLAFDLTRASRTPLRKVAVRSTIAASVAAALIVGWVSFFAPEHRVAAPPAGQAQQPAASDASKKTENRGGSSLKTVLQDEELFPAYLTKQTDVDFNGTPLAEVCRALEAMHGIPVVLHRKALDEEGIATNLPVTLKVSGLTFEEVLNHLAMKTALAWDVDAGLIRITTTNEVRYIIRQFDIQEPLARRHSRGSLMNLIMRLTPEDNVKWEQTDGEGGTMAPVGESLLVSQTFHCQRRIAKLLAVIEGQYPFQTPLDVCTGRDDIRKTLSEQGSVEFTEIPLQGAMKKLADERKIQILINERDLSDEGVSLDIPVSLTRKNRPLGSLLDELLDEHGLTYAIRDGVILITTQSSGESDMHVVAYDVRELIGGDHPFGQLMSAIHQMIRGDRTKWEQMDGEGGTLVPSPASGCLFVKQTDQNQERIQTLIDQLKRTGKPRPSAPETTSAAPGMIMKAYRMPKEIASDLLTALPKLVAPESWKTGVGGEFPMLENVASRPERDSVQGMVSGADEEVQVLESAPAEQTSTDAQPAKPRKHAVSSIVFRPRSMLIIRQTPDVHQKIQKFLLNLDIPFEVGTPDNVHGLELPNRSTFRPGFMGGMGGGMGGMGGGFGGGMGFMGGASGSP